MRLTEVFVGSDDDIVALDLWPFLGLGHTTSFYCIYYLYPPRAHVLTPFYKENMVKHRLRLFSVLLWMHRGLTYATHQFILTYLIGTRLAPPVWQFFLLSWASVGGVDKMMQ